MRPINLALQELGEVRDSKGYINDVPIMYSVVGLAAGIELSIYRKMGKWWITGSRPGQGPYWPGGYNSTEEALAAILQFFLSTKCRAGQIG